tara:strand:+ start:55 stop:537 length:483 start_codon:yes stop_codon:yes gene_type:complete
MNAVALRAEKAVADYLAAADWSASGAGTPTCLTSYSRGLYDDPDLEDVMPNFPRLVVSTNSARPVQRVDLTNEVEVSVELQLSADDTDEAAVLTTVQVLDNRILPLFDDSGASALDAPTNDANGPFTAQFAAPLDFGAASISNRSRTFTRTFTLYCSATL